MQQKLLDFVAQERYRFKAMHNNMFASSFSEVQRYHDFLAIIHERHILTVAKFITTIDELNKSIGKEPGSHPMTEIQMMLYSEHIQAGTHIQLEVESFYLFAKILLDKIARAIEFYFGQAQKLSLDSHDDFVKKVKAYCNAKDLTLNEELFSLANTLKKDISDFRDYQIAHLKNPRTVRGFSGDGRMHVSQMYPREKDEPKQTEFLETLYDEIEKYIELMIAFIADNKEKTALHINQTVQDTE